MKRSRLIGYLFAVPFAAVLVGGAAVLAPLGPSFDLSWHTIDGGGGTSTGGGFDLSGTIGQPDAGLMTGGDFELRGGFWIASSLPPNTADLSGPLGPGFPDGCVDAFDLGTLLGAWCSSASDPDPPDDIDPPCEGCTSPNFTLADISGAANVPDGCVDAFDLAKLLANWCSVAGGNPCGTCQ
ncbi:MAG: hypothetical protein O6941_05625 [Planctomycetota bacterium]|nr:hypothetical protein [Planctomycetota bacterium]